MSSRALVGTQVLRLPSLDLGSGTAQGILTDAERPCIGVLPKTAYIASESATPAVGSAPERVDGARVPSGNAQEPVDAMRSLGATQKSSLTGPVGMSSAGFDSSAQELDKQKCAAESTKHDNMSVMKPRLRHVQASALDGTFLLDDHLDETTTCLMIKRMIASSVGTRTHNCVYKLVAEGSKPVDDHTALFELSEGDEICLTVVQVSKVTAREWDLEALPDPHGKKVRIGSWSDPEIGSFVKAARRHLPEGRLLPEDCRETLLSKREFLNIRDLGHVSCWVVS
eukprot:TRINITY_DN62131_c0_g1_i1.p1 TRINITY_DN62131_c0_g1~~TRINITY_DN62131_c0_g1_i1.p1  ORF type:complete len:283 (-),score=46.70 TRINITY_DN62131_c0_g1_i1:133-981(-)